MDWPEGESRVNGTLGVFTGWGSRWMSCRFSLAFCVSERLLHRGSHFLCLNVSGFGWAAGDPDVHVAVGVESLRADLLFHFCD